MKLIDISALCLSRPHEPFRQWFSATFHVYKADCSILVINMDEGICGISEPSTYGAPYLIHQEIERRKSTLIGKYSDTEKLAQWIIDYGQCTPGPDITTDRRVGDFHRTGIVAVGHPERKAGHSGRLYGTTHSTGLGSRISNRPGPTLPIYRRPLGGSGKTG